MFKVLRSFIWCWASSKLFICIQLWFFDEQIKESWLSRESLSKCRQRKNSKKEIRSQDLPKQLIRPFFQFLITLFLQETGEKWLGWCFSTCLNISRNDATVGFFIAPSRHSVFDGDLCESVGTNEDSFWLNNDNNICLQ